MSAFIATGSGTPFNLTNDGWFPDIDANAARESLRLDGTVTDTRLESALVNAMLSVNAELAEFKADRRGICLSAAGSVGQVRRLPGTPDQRHRAPPRP